MTRFSTLAVALILLLAFGLSVATFATASPDTSETPTEDAYNEPVPGPGDPYFEMEDPDGHWISYINPRDEYRSPYLGDGSGKICVTLLNEDGEPIVGESIPGTSVSIPIGEELQWHTSAADGSFDVHYPLTANYDRPLDADQFGTTPELPQGDGYMDSHCIEWHGMEAPGSTVAYDEADVYGEYADNVDVVGYVQQVSSPDDRGWDTDVDPIADAEPYAATNGGWTYTDADPSHGQSVVVLQLDPDATYPGDGDTGDDDEDDTDPEPETYSLDIVAEDEDGNTIDDADVTVSGQDGASHELEEGMYSVFIDADGYESIEEETVVLDEDTTAVFTMTEEDADDGTGDEDDTEIYPVDVIVEDEDGNTIDDADVTVNGEAGTSHELEEGTYTFAADADGYDARSGDLTIDEPVDVIITLSEEDAELPEPPEGDVHVDVGEMYFQQAGMQEDVLAADVGDEIVFYNDGNTPHTVTIDEYGLDERIHPGESVTLTVDEPAEDVLVDCTDHDGHDATLTVTGDDETGDDDSSDDDTGDDEQDPTDGDIPTGDMGDAFDHPVFQGDWSAFPDDHPVFGDDGSMFPDDHPVFGSS